MVILKKYNAIQERERERERECEVGENKEEILVSYIKKEKKKIYTV